MSAPFTFGPGSALAGIARLRELLARIVSRFRGTT